VPVTVKLGTVILPSDHKVYKFFPGKSYKFYDLITDKRIAVLDIRGLDDLGSPSSWKDDAILTRIAQDRVDRMVAAGGTKPSRLVRSVGDKAALTFLKGLLFTARKGDLILMPDKGYTTLVRVGELLDDAGDVRSFTATDDGTANSYFGRRVRWLANIEKRKFSLDLINLLQTQSAFFDIGRSHYEEVYQLTFDNYVYDGQYVATFTTSKNVFTSKDALLTSVWFELLEVLEESKKLDKDSSIYDLAVDSQINEDERNDLSINVMSPGWFKLRSLAATPLVAMALYSMAVENIPYEQAKAATVSAKVIRTASDECLGQVDKSVKDYLELLGKDRWEQACKHASKTQDQATLKTDAQLTKTAKNAKHRP
jgi:hypothetical protein